MSKLTIHQGDLCFVSRVDYNPSVSNPYILVRDEKSGKQIYSPVDSFNLRDLASTEVSVYSEISEVKFYQPDKLYYVKRIIRAADISRFFIIDFDHFEERLEEMNRIKKEEAETRDRVAQLSKKYQENLIKMIDIELESLNLKRKHDQLDCENERIIKEFSDNLGKKFYDSRLLEDEGFDHPEYCYVYAKFKGSSKIYCWMRPKYLRKIYIVPGMKLKVTEVGDDYPIVTKVEYSDKPSNHKEFISIVL